MNIFIYTGFSKEEQQYLAERLPAGTPVTFRTQLSEQEARQALQQATVLLGNPPPEWLQQPLPALSFWQISSAGFNQYSELTISIPVANMGDFFARPCAETIVGGVLAFYRGIHHLARLQTTKTWKSEGIRQQLRLLSDQQAIILGAGAIGKATRQMLKGFGCPVQLMARTNPAASIHGFDDLLSALPQTTLLINTLPGSAKKYVSAAVFEALPAGSVYASVGRGDTTDEMALTEALRTGKLAGAVLDVTDKEPLPANSPLWNMENVLLTQHTGGGQMGEAKGIADQFLRNLARFLDQKPLENEVILAKGY